MQLVFCGADVKYVSSDGSESRTPYGLAKAANQELQMELLMQNGAITVEQEPVRTPDSPADNLYETVHEVKYTQHKIRCGRCLTQIQNAQSQNCISIACCGISFRK